jgi:hypothetical protein
MEMSYVIPLVVCRNKSAMAALERGDRVGAVSACQRDAVRIDRMLEQIKSQYDAVLETANQTRGFAEDIERDASIFAAACQEATR